MLEKVNTDFFLPGKSNIVYEKDIVIVLNMSLNFSS